MATIKKIQKDAAFRVWRFAGNGLNNPNICQPSEWLVGQLLRQFSANQVSDQIWEIAHRALRLRFPGLERPLGSCYRPWTADILDVAFHYGDATQRVFRRVAEAAATVVSSERELWTRGPAPELELFPPAGRAGRKHIELCPQYMGQLARAIRESRAPKVREISPSFFEEYWDFRLADMRAVDADTRERFAPYIELMDEFCVERYSFREGEIDLVVDQGGDLCSHSTSNGRSWDDLSHDGEMEVLEPAPQVHGHSNQYHNGCYSGPACVMVHGATFLLVKRTELWPAGRIQKLARVVVTPAVSLEVLRERLASWREGTANPRKGGAWNYLLSYK